MFFGEVIFTDRTYNRIHYKQVCNVSQKHLIIPVVVVSSEAPAGDLLSVECKMGLKGIELHNP